MYKMVLFDVDGTLMTVDIWTALHTQLDVLEAAEINKKKYFDGKLSATDWVLQDIELWKDKKVTKQMMIDYANPILTPGVKETVTELKNQDLQLGIVSGCLDFVFAHAFPDYKKYFSHIYINQVFFKKDGQIDHVLPNPYGVEKKAHALHKICKKEKIRPDEVVFVGDNFNDHDIIQEAGLGIAFNPKNKTLEKIADVVVRSNDLRDILRYI